MKHTLTNWVENIVLTPLRDGPSQVSSGRTMSGRDNNNPNFKLKQCPFTLERMARADPVIFDSEEWSAQYQAESEQVRKDGALAGEGEHFYERAIAKERFECFYKRAIAVAPGARQIQAASLAPDAFAGQFRAPCAPLVRRALEIQAQPSHCLAHCGASRGPFQALDFRRWLAHAS